MTEDILANLNPTDTSTSKKTRKCRVCGTKTQAKPYRIVALLEQDWTLPQHMLAFLCLWTVVFSLNLSFL